jgi:hypothetical protein
MSFSFLFLFPFSILPKNSTKEKRKKMNKIYYTLLPSLFLQTSNDKIGFKTWIHNFFCFPLHLFLKTMEKVNNRKTKTMKIIMISIFPFWTFFLLFFCSFILPSLWMRVKWSKGYENQHKKYMAWFSFHLPQYIYIYIIFLLFLGNYINAKDRKK